MYNRITVTWSTRREGNDGYILESYSDGSEVEIGPMPAHVVPSAVLARRRLVALKMDDQGHHYILVH